MISTLVDLPELHNLAAAWLLTVSPGAIIYLEGPLGVGKTTFVQAVLASGGYHGLVKSPTYTLVESYDCPLRRFFHFDLYRLKDPSELEYIGIRDYLDKEAICLIEWPEKGVGFLPKADWLVTLAYQGEQRLLTIQRG